MSGTRCKWDEPDGVERPPLVLTQAASHEDASDASGIEDKNARFSIGTVQSIAAYFRGGVFEPIEGSPVVDKGG
jgi:hypothetical protein